MEQSQAVKKQPKCRGGNTGNGFDKNPGNINKDGRPDASWTWRELFMEELEEKAKRDERMKKKKAIAQAIVDKAEDGDLQAFDRIADRIEGKPKQLTDLTTAGEKLEGISVILK